jgi:hypothetical protein
MTIGDLLNRIERHALADDRTTVDVRRKKAVVARFLREAIGLPDGWRERIAAVPAGTGADYALALADAAKGKRVNRDVEPLPLTKTPPLI